MGSKIYIIYQNNLDVPTKLLSESAIGILNNRMLKESKFKISCVLF